MKTYHIPIFVPHKGCPHDCVFCNQKHITGTTEDTTKEDVKRIIEEHISTIDKDSYSEVAFFGGSFTGIEICKQTELMEAAYTYVKEGRVSGLRCSTRPDYITDEILSNLKNYGMKCIELGVQSTDPEVLINSNRGHTYDDVVGAAQLIKKWGIELGVQMMLGLPGDNIDKMIKTAKDLISLNPTCVRIYPTLVVRDTYLHQMYQKGEYSPLELEECVEYLSIIMPMFKRAGINIIRVGLQTTDDINESTVNGPYHPAIRELAESRIIRNAMIPHIKDITSLAEVFCAPSLVSKVIGHHRSNKEFFAREYGVEIKVICDKKIDTDKLKICDKIVEFY